MISFVLTMVAVSHSANALGCKDITILLKSGVPTIPIVTAIYASSPPPTTADLECLIRGGAPDVVVQAVRSLNAKTVYEKTADPVSYDTNTSSIQSSSTKETQTGEYDCLGGVCLDSELQGKMERKVVAIGAHFAIRDVDTCSGRVVRVLLITQFEHFSPTSSSGRGLESYMNFWKSELAKSGWGSVDGVNHSAPTVPVSVFLANDHAIGLRNLFVGDDSPDDGSGDAFVFMKTVHPQYEQLCAGLNPPYVPW